MRIGIYDPYLDDLGGGEKYMLTIAEVLSAENNVDIFWDNKEDLEGSQSRFALNLEKVRLVPNLFNAQTSITTRFLKSRKYDAIIVLSDGSIPIVSSKLYVHVQQPLKQFQSKSIKEKLKLARVSAFFCNSEFTRGFISGKFGLKTIVIYPPVELHPKKLKKTNTILHVGRFRVKNIPIDDYKKQNILVDTFKKMVDEGLKGWEFMLCVSVLPKDEEAFSRLQKKAKGYPIVFNINKNNKELWEYYSKAKIYWHASGYGEDLVLHPEYAEHFGISTVEAMGSGVVPVVINAGGQKEIVTNGVNGFTWDTLSECIEKTQKLIDSPQLLSEMSKKAELRAADFSRDEFARKIRDMVKK